MRYERPEPRKPQSRSEENKRFGWRLIRVSYFAVKVWAMIFVLLGLGVAGSVAYSRWRGTESIVGRVISLVRRSVDQRIALITSSPEEGELVEQRFATLTFVSGRVEIQRATDLAWKSGQDGMKLASGDRVRTFSSARAEVGFDDGNVLRIKPDSLIVIGDLTENVRTKVRKSSVRLLVSNIEADIKKSVVRGSQFRLEMPTATADIDKARMSVEIRPDNRSQVSVYSGQVDLDTGSQKIQVTDRKTVMISALKEITKPENLLPAPKLSAPRPLETFPSATGGVTLSCVWNPIPGARAYRLEIAGDRFFDKPVVSRDDLRETTFVTPSLGQGIYHVRVAALDALGRMGDFAAPVPVRIVVDRQPPFIEIQKFVVLQTGRGREVLVNGRTEPGATVSVGGRPVVVDETGYFSAVLRGIAAGQDEMEFLARDRAGNSKSLLQKVQS
ncbi:MAG: FecR family protein [Candidatus Geothermincolia bacterium]